MGKSPSEWKYLSRFGQTVSEIRKSLGLTQEELAERSKLHRTYISLIERGKRNVTIINIIKIAKGLDIEIGELFNFSLNEKD